MSGAPTEPQPRPLWLRTLLPHALTALVSVAVAVAITRVSSPSSVPVVAKPTLAAATSTRVPEPISSTPQAPTPQVTPTLEPTAVGVTRRDLLDLRAEDDELRVALWLLRGLNHLADADLALRINNAEAAERALLTTDEALRVAEVRANDALRDPITQLRREVGGVRDDLYLRPQGLDTRIARLRQSILALIGEPPAP